MFEFIAPLGVIGDEGYNRYMALDRPAYLPEVLN